jgi:hypothetical protein
MVHFAKAFPLCRIIDYNTTPSIPRPIPESLPTVKVDFNGINLLETSRLLVKSSELIQAVLMMQMK